MYDRLALVLPKHLESKIQSLDSHDVNKTTGQRKQAEGKKKPA